MNAKSFTLNFLDPHKIHFALTPGGLLQLTLEGVGAFPQIKLYRAFPFSARGQYLSIRDGSDKHEPEIGILEELNELSTENRALLEAELQARYFIPRITRIQSLVSTYEILEWKVETDRGPRRFTVKDVHDRIRLLGDSHFLIVDMEECRYEIPNLKTFPQDQQRLFLRHFFR
jgi:hypothetical protein